MLVQGSVCIPVADSFWCLAKLTQKVTLDLATNRLMSSFAKFKLFVDWGVSGSSSVCENFLHFSTIYSFSEKSYIMKGFFSPNTIKEIKRIWGMLSYKLNLQIIRQSHIIQLFQIHFTWLVLVLFTTEPNIMNHTFDSSSTRPNI